MEKLIIDIYTNLYHRITGASYGSDHWKQNNVTTPNRDDYSQHVEFNHVHHFGLDILSDFGGTEGPCLMQLLVLGKIAKICISQIFGLCNFLAKYLRNVLKNCSNEICIRRGSPIHI